MEWRRYLHFMQAFRANTLRAEETLVELGYQFSESAVAEPCVDRTHVIELIERHGVRFPAALRAFYDTFNGISFEGAAPAAWGGCAYPDPISVVPLDSTFWLSELESMREEGSEMFSPQIAGDHIHKAGFSGGSYNLVFDDADDPTVIGGDIPRMKFTAYLALCDAWSGFPGLRHSPTHTWPLAEIRRGFVCLP